MVGKGAASGSFIFNCMAICRECSRVALMDAEDRLSGLYFMNANDRRFVFSPLASLESREPLLRSRAGDDPKRLLIVLFRLLCEWVNSFERKETTKLKYRWWALEC